jgi:hypothetical protein
MVFVNRKLVKHCSFKVHTETILILQKSVKRQLRFLSLSLAFTVQLCAITTEGTTRDGKAQIAHGTVAGMPTVLLSSLERIGADVSLAMKTPICGEKSTEKTARVVTSATREASMRRVFDTHKTKAYLDLVAYAKDKGSSDSIRDLLYDNATGNSCKRSGRPPIYPGAQVRRRNADGSPTRARVTTIKV